MIEFLCKWIEGIAIAVIIASIFEIMLPNGNIKKVIKAILGIYVVFSIILPFSEHKVRGELNFFKNNNQILENTNLIDNSNDEKSSENRLNKIYENTFEKEIIRTIEKEGFIIYKCEVKGNFNAEEKNAGIAKISITIESKKIIKNKQENDDNEIKIDNVNEIKKVEINVHDKVVTEKEEDVDAKDIDTLRKYLSKHYEIDKGVIDIYIR